MAAISHALQNSQTNLCSPTNTNATHFKTIKRNYRHCRFSCEEPKRGAVVPAKESFVRIAYHIENMGK